MSLKHTLKYAQEEIISLRRRNELLEAQVGVMELFRRLIMLRTPGGMAEDAVRKIEQELRTLEASKAEALVPNERI